MCVVIESNPTVVIELYENDGAVDAIVKDVVVVGAADPGVQNVWRNFPWFNIRRPF